MSEIYIPFTHGQSEAVDAKLLPQGLFYSAQNCRYTKDARLAVRNAYNGVITNTALAAASYSPSEDLYFSSNVPAPPVCFQARNNVAAGAGLTYADIPSGILAPPQLLFSNTLPFTNLRSVAAVATFYANETNCYVAYTVIDSNNSPNNYNPVDGRYLYLARINARTGAILTEISVAAGFAQASNVKLAIVNGLICVFYVNASDQIRMSSYNVNTLAVSTDNALVATAVAGKGTYFDISAGGSSTEAYLVYPSAASTLSFGTVTSAGVYAQLSTIAGTGTDLRPSICPSAVAASDRVVIVWLDGNSFTIGNAKYTVYRRSTTSFIVATTSAYTNGDATGYPGASSLAAAECCMAFNTTTAIPSAVVFQQGTAFADGTSRLYGHYIMSKPFLMGSVLAVLTTDANASTDTGNYFIALCKPGATYEPQVVSEFSQLKAQPAQNTILYKDPRQTIQVGLPTIGSAPGSLGILFAAGTKTSGGTFLQVYRAEYGNFEDHFNAAKLNGDLHFSGGRITAYDGRVVTETGFSLPPTPTLAATAGNLLAGTYQVVVVWEWFDNKGRRHRSAPSNIASITLTTTGGITCTVTRPYSTNKNIAATVDGNVQARVYRNTLNQPAVFTDATGRGTSLSNNVTTSITLSDDDITVAAREGLYTQGAVGGLSGRLQNDRPPGAKYICAGSDRLMIGGMENPSEVWWSKIRTEGEPMQWVNNATWKAQIDGIVTAVAEMDGLWYIATADAWWTVSGDGPQDNGANGSFGAPRKLPSSIGCISHKSVVYTDKGFMFQGATDRMYLMPRGGTTPQPVGWQVRDTLTAYPFITASTFNKTSNTAYWACSNTAGTNGRMLVYDTRINEWYIDVYLTNRLIRALAIENGALHIDGQALEFITGASHQDTDGNTAVNIATAVTTGDVRPFGMSGHGSLRKCVILGEDLDGLTIGYTMTLGVSYDSGKTFTDTGSWLNTALSPNGLESFEADHLLLYPKGNTYRFQLSWTPVGDTPGLVFNGLSLEIYPERGLSRLPQSKRA